MMLWSDLRFEDVLLAVTANPAKALGLKGRGRIEPGGLADFTLLDKQFQVARTYVGGTLAYG
jgi:N-acetylglucosamine-6-phosphate deacetylase